MASCCETSLLGCSCGSSKHGDVGTGTSPFLQTFPSGMCLSRALAGLLLVDGAGLGGRAWASCYPGWHHLLHPILPVSLERFGDRCGTELLLIHYLCSMLPLA